MASMYQSPSKPMKMFCPRFVAENAHLPRQNVMSKVSLKLGCFIKSLGAPKYRNAIERLREFHQNVALNTFILKTDD